MSAENDHPDLGPLATPAQLASERLILDLLATEQVQRARGGVVDLYRADPFHGSRPAGMATIERAAASITTAAVQQALLSDGTRPGFLWVVSPGRSWHGIEMPDSGYGIDNPDNVHRRTAIDGRSTYLIRGRIPSTPPAQFSFICYATPEADGAVTREGAQIASVALSSDLVADDEGHFEITVGPEPADPATGGNHLQTQPTSTWITLRDALTDWDAQDPIRVEIERTGGPGVGPEATTAELAEMAATRAAQLSTYWLAWNNEFIYSRRPVNALTQPAPRPFGTSVAGQFDLADSEGLLITLDPMGADYLGFEAADPWGVTHPSVAATGGLNSNQVLANDDGTVTYLVAATDPGVHNWIDTNGAGAGIIVARWQGGSFAADAEPVIDVRVVALDDTSTHFAANHLVSAEQRDQQRAARAASYARRLR